MPPLLSHQHSCTFRRAVASPAAVLLPLAAGLVTACTGSPARQPSQPGGQALTALISWLTSEGQAYPATDGALQTAWDRLLSRRPVLLLMLGSDLHMMERLTAYDRPFFGRADKRQRSLRGLTVTERDWPGWPGCSRSVLPIRGGLSLRRSGERLRAELPTLAYPATAAVCGTNVPMALCGAM